MKFMTAVTRIVQELCCLQRLMNCHNNCLGTVREGQTIACLLVETRSGDLSSTSCVTVEREWCVKGGGNGKPPGKPATPPSQLPCSWWEVHMTLCASFISESGSVSHVQQIRSVGPQQTGSLA